MDVEYDAEIAAESLDEGFADGRWPRNISGPRIGSLDPPVVERLATLLRPFTAAQDCFFYYDRVIPLWLGNVQEQLLQGKLEHVLECVESPVNRFYYSPSIWWPADRAWCVATHLDFAYTFIGGSETLVQQLIADPMLEVLAIGLDARAA